MSRPEHLSCPNTPEGIRRINENQTRYDEDPDAYEREQDERAAEAEAEERARGEAEYQAEQEANDEAEYYASQGPEQ